ncbi:Protein N-lysine methyltransferase METTL21A [Euphorbia peplus]|nr:Protein N-lysine methyltransferase METTL21A [Euphorbia peplus]
MDPPHHQDDDEDDNNIHPLRIFLPDDHNHDHNQLKSTMLHHTAPNQNHYIASINSTILIRQLPSQGLSFQLWPAATTLVTLLDLHRSSPASSPLSPVINALSLSCTTAPLRILELGSGTGLVGIAAAMTLGANVTVTDLPHVISNLKFNVDANVEAVGVGGGSVDVAALRWGKEGNGDVEMLGKDFDLIIASDVVYHDHLYEPLLYTLRLVMDDGENIKGKMKKKKVFVMAHLRRWKKESSFFKKAKKLFHVEVIHVDIPCEGSRIGVAVYLFSHKPPRV